jgi:hypothetical protein
MGWGWGLYVYDQKSLLIPGWDFFTIKFRVAIFFTIKVIVDSGLGFFYDQIPGCNFVNNIKMHVKSMSAVQIMSNRRPAIG